MQAGHGGNSGRVALVGIDHADGIGRGVEHGETPEIGSGSQVVAFTLRAERGSDPQRVIVRKTHFVMRSITDGRAADDLLGVGVENGQNTCKIPVRL